MQILSIHFGASAQFFCGRTHLPNYILCRNPTKDHLFLSIDFICQSTGERIGGSVEFNRRIGRIGWSYHIIDHVIRRRRFTVQHNSCRKLSAPNFAAPKLILLPVYLSYLALSRRLYKLVHIPTYVCIIFIVNLYIVKHKLDGNNLALICAQSIVNAHQ